VKGTQRAADVTRLHRVSDAVDILHGITVPDPYRWLEQRDSEQTQNWLDEQARLFDSAKADWGCRRHWRKRLEDLLGSGSVGPPVWRSERYFQMRRDPGQEHAVLQVHDKAGVRVLLDPQEIDSTGLTTLDSWMPTKEGHRLAYQLSVGGTEESEVHVLDVETGEHLEGPIDRARYSPIAWLPGGLAYYYVRRLPPEQVPAGEEQFHRRVWLHKVGDDPDNDVMIFGEHRKHTEYFGVSVSRDGRWLSVSASEGTAPRNDLWVADLDASPIDAPALVAVQVDIDAQTGLRFGRDGLLYVFTDRDAPRGRIAVTTHEHPEPSMWADLIPEDTIAVLEGYAILDGNELRSPLMLVSWTRHAISEITIHDLETGRKLGNVELPGHGTVGGLLERPEGGHEAWFIYTDNATIPRVMHYDAFEKDLTVSDYPPGFVEVPQISSTVEVVTSGDGTEVRMLVMAPTDSFRSDGLPDRSRPTILHGYGGFGVSMAPSYSPSIVAWVEAGGIYAIACIRGGTEEGEQWHRDGMLANKQNVFDDFIACATWLTDKGITTPEQLALSGGSNGGLLVGAVMTQRPDLMTAVHCSAPLLDMIRYESFGLGATWNVEFGSAAVPEEFAWLWSYSPYHKVTEGFDYPAVLFTVFDHDTRVDPMHARKMCAALQGATTSRRPILIRSEANVGHGARSMSRSVELSADVLSFLAESTGLARDISPGQGA